MKTELFTSNQRSHSEEQSVSLEYGFLADRVLIAIELVQLGKQLGIEDLECIGNLRHFLIDLAELARKDPLVTAMTEDKKLYSIYTSGDLHKALGVRREERANFANKIDDFAYILAK